MKKTLLTIVLPIAIFAVGCQGAQAPNQNAQTPSENGQSSGEDTQASSEQVVERLDPALDAIISPDAKLQELGAREHFGVTEGTIWVKEGQSGYLLFSDISANVIYKWAPPDQVSVFMEKSGYTGDDPMNTGRISRSGILYVNQLGSNGLYLDREGRLIVCAQGDRTLVRIEKDGTRTMLADRYEGKRFNGPNDVVVKSNGSMYFTDPGSGLRSEALREMNYRGIFLVKDGKVQLLDKDPQGGSPNGIAFSPDEKYLYISASGKLVRYEVRPDDTLANAQVFVAGYGSDGMRVDTQGNLYTTTEGGVYITSPQGKHLGTIRVPKVPGFGTTNVGFGEDGKTLFIAARLKVYSTRLNVAGPMPGQS